MAVAAKVIDREVFEKKTTASAIASTVEFPLCSQLELYNHS